MVGIYEALLSKNEKLYMMKRVRKSGIPSINNIFHEEIFVKLILWPQQMYEKIT